MTDPRTSVSIFIVITLGLTLAAPAHSFFSKKSPDKKRAEIHEIRDEALARLYKEQPEAEGIVDNAVGYAVFSNFGANLGIVSTASGKGLAHENSDDTDTYMKMYSVGGGIGLGLKTFSAVFVFHSRDAFVQFVEKGWDFSGQADAAATKDAEAGEDAGAMDETIALMKEVTVYQLTDKGLALQATLQRKSFIC